MIKSIKIRLFPTKKQEILMFKSVGATRFAYNWGLAKQQENYENGGKFIDCRKLRDEFILLKKTEEFKWLNEISSETLRNSFDTLQIAYNRFFQKLSNKPKFKSKKRSRQSFYVRHDRINFFKEKQLVSIEKIGRVKYKSNYEIPQLKKYINPRCNFDGKYWYLTLGWEHEEIQNKLTDLSLGIDVGIKDLAICSNGMKFKNINKSKKIKRLKKKLKRLQRQASRKYEVNKKGSKFVKTKNIIKLEKQIKLIHRKLNNIRLNYIHQTTSMIMKTKPHRIVMEHLNIQGMMKNKHLAKAIQEQNLYEFKRQMEYKCKFNGIDFIEADRWYPSSKICSECGHIKKVLKLSERVYVCEECGCVIDRDLNASINLSKYSA